MVQSLCIHMLGPGVVIFGPGPDGAREAMYKGEIPFPNDAKHWDGHLVVQAKCRERLRHSASDATWLIAQLKRDLEKFLDKKRDLPRPEYYILCTNVTLSSVPEKGGKAKVDRVLATYAKRLKLKGFAVWSADQLRGLLENATDVRTAYTAWLTPSDVLAKLVDDLGRRDLRRLLPLALARDIREERDVRLRDAGQETDQGVKLDEVFVDLPIIVDAPQEAVFSRFLRQGDRSRGSKSETASGRGLLRHLIRRCADKFGRSEYEQRERHAKPRGLPNRIVVLGGPGQGKSTLGQFLAQFSRARLLRASSCDVNPQAQDAVGAILERAVKEDLPSTGPARFPIRIDLPGFADALQKARDDDQSLTLLCYMARRMSRKLDSQVTADDLRAWLGTCPSLLILDGLDEVPPSGNRVPVVQAIDALWDDLHFVNGDAVVIVTTRPQGYNRDLDPEYWEHWELAPLEPSDAIRYAKQLSEVRLSDADRRDAIIAELERASEDPATVHLMMTPLQVTIMFGIAMLKGVIPQDRWDLFDRYYNLLRDREAEKAGAASQLIRRFKQQIDVLHREAGFLLHLEAEAAGGATPFLTGDQFREMSERLLRSQGYDEETITSVAGELVRIATERLVLLRARVQGQIAFDVRSLQEYMAAAEITSGEPTLVLERLKDIALSAHWRHVFRIAASKLFSVGDFDYMRDGVLSIGNAADCGDLSQAGRLSHGGARLALDLMSDGIATTLPKYHKQLYRRALGMLELGPESFDQRLIKMLSSTTAEVFREEVVRRLQQGRTPAALSAWKATFAAMESEDHDVDNLVEKHWPAVPRDGIQILEATKPSCLTPASKNIVDSTQWKAGPSATIGLQNSIYSSMIPAWSTRSAGAFSDPVSILPPEVFQLPYLQNTSWRHMQTGILVGQNESVARAMFIQLEADRKTKFSLDIPQGLDTKAAQAWAALGSVLHFIQVPRAKTLAAAVRSFETIDFVGESYIGLPWVLESLLHDYQEGASCAELVAEVESGMIGDVSDWRRAQNRLAKHGITPNDVRTWGSGRYLSQEIASVGVPHFLYLRWTTEDHIADLHPLLDAVAELRHASKQVRFVDAFLFGLRSIKLEPRNLDMIRELAHRMRVSLDSQRSARFVLLHADVLLRLWEREFVDAVDEVGRRMSYRLVGVGDVRVLVESYNGNLGHRGLLPAILATIVTHHEVEKLPGALDALNQMATTFLETDESAVRVAVACLQLLTGRWRLDDAEDLADILSGPTIEPMHEARFGALIRAISTTSHGSLTFFFTLLARRLLEKNPTRLNALLERLNAMSSAERSALTNQERRYQLKLPLGAAAGPLVA